MAQSKFPDAFIPDENSVSLVLHGDYKFHKLQDKWDTWIWGITINNKEQSWRVFGQLHNLLLSLNLNADEKISARIDGTNKYNVFVAYDNTEFESNNFPKDVEEVEDRSPARTQREQRKKEIVEEGGSNIKETDYASLMNECVAQAISIWTSDTVKSALADIDGGNNMSENFRVTATTLFLARKDSGEVAASDISTYFVMPAQPSDESDVDFS